MAQHTGVYKTKTWLKIVNKPQIKDNASSLMFIHSVKSKNSHLMGLGYIFMLGSLFCINALSNLQKEFLFLLALSLMFIYLVNS